MKKLPLAILFSALYLSLTLLPFIPLLSFDYHNHQRLLQVILLCLCSLIFLTQICIDKKLYIQPNINTLIYFFIVMGIVSSLLSKEKTYSLFYTCHLLLLFLFSLRIINEENTKNVLYFIIFLVATHSILLLVCFLNIIFSFADNIALSPYIIYQNFIHIRFFNQVQIFILPLLIFFLRYKQTRRIIIFFISLNLFLLLIGHARGALLSFLLISITATLLSNNLKQHYKTGLICFMGSFSIYFLIVLISPIDEISINTTTSGRYTIWLNTISEMGLEKIFIGSGPGVFQISLGSQSPLSHPHNSIIEVINEWGGLAFLSLCTAIILTIKRAIYHIKNHTNDSISEALLFTFLSGLTYSFVSGVHVMPVSQTMLFIFWGLLLSRISKGNLTSLTISVKYRVAFAILLAALWYFYGCVALETYQKMNPDNGYLIGPRFWSIAHRL